MPTEIKNERVLVLRIRYDSTKVRRCDFTDALGDTVRLFASADLIEADEASGQMEGGYDWEFLPEESA